MKQIYKIYLVCMGLILLNFNSFSQGFSHKTDNSINRMRSSSAYRRNIGFTKLFNYPSEIETKSDLSINSDIIISYTSTNESKLFFDGYYYSKYSGLYFYYNIPANSYGNDTLTITISYKGIEASSKIITSTDPIECLDNQYDLDIGDTLEVNVISNDKPRGFFDFTTFEILSDVNHGISEIKEEGFIKYINNAGTENYTSDSIIYRISDIDNNYDTAKVIFNIHKNSYVSKVFDFIPAPGQFVNTGWADSSASKNIIGKSNGGVSLGGYGGYIIAGFDQPIVDRDENAYGVDFTVDGNAFGAWGGGSWCEPAAVQVMKDENKNGLPDDEWYELAGANYYLNSTIKDLTMTYYNPKHNSRHTITYSTDKGISGAMRTNGFHSQPYYPDPYNFNISPDSISYTGNKIKFQLDKSNPGYIECLKWPTFGYADNHPSNRNPTHPTNPYFEDENGKPSDGFDLKWAVDKNGVHTPLDTIHFVKIYNPSQEDGGWLGEVSPEIFRISITTPEPNYTPKDYEFNYIGSSQIHVLKGTKVKYDGIFFKNGIPQTGTAHWVSDSTHVATVDNTGLLTATENGQTILRFSMKAGIPEDSIKIAVVEIDSIFIEMVGNYEYGSDTISMIVGEKEHIQTEARIKGDGYGTSGYGNHNRYPYETYNYSSTNANVGTIHEGLFTSITPGITKIITQSTHYPELKDTIVVIVNAIPDIKALADTINLPYYQRTGIFKNDELFTTENTATVWFKSYVSSGRLINAEIKSNTFEYTMNENRYGCEKITFTVEAYGKSKDIDIVFKAIEPDNYTTQKQILFVNGGQSGNTDYPTQLMSYLPEKDITIKLDNYLANATSAQDLIINGNFAFVSADNYITRYNISTGIATDSVYTQDLNSELADGKGTAGIGVNNKIAIYGNMLLATRQFSSGAPEDGYNIRIYNKGDLSFIKKIPVSNQATDIVIIDDKAFVMINGKSAGSTSSIAKIDLKTLTLTKEINLGTKGLGVMQMIAKENNIYCIRLSNFSNDYKSGIVIYNITNENVEELEHDFGITSDSSPLAIEPMTNDTLFVKKDFGYIAFNTQTKTFGSEINFSIPKSYTQDLDHNGKGSVYDQLDNKYYVAYSYSNGEGVGQIYNSNLDSTGVFKGVGASAEVMKICQTSTMNEKPYVAYDNAAKTFNEGEDFKFRLGYSTFKDNEDRYPSIYLYNPAQYNWLVYESGTRYIKGNFNGEILEPTSYNVLIQGIDKQGAFEIDTVKIIINPVDDAPFVANPIADITVDEDATISGIDLTDVFDDLDNENAEITKVIISANNESLVSLNITNNVLNATLKPEQSGEIEIVIEATSNMLTVTDTFNIIVNNIDDKPMVINPIVNITVNEDATISDIDLTEVFNDIDNENAEITKAIISTNDERVVSLNITDNTLSASLKADQYGELEVVIEATSNLLTVTDTFNIIVNNVDDEPVVINPIANIIIDEDATISDIDLTNVFNDIDNENTEITKAIISTNDESLVSLNITDNKLSAALQADQFGELEVVIEATSNLLTVTDTFKIIVNNIDDKPVVSNPISDIIVDEDATISDIDLTNVFNDIDNKNATISKAIISTNDESLVSLNITDNKLSAALKADQFGKLEVVIEATSNLLTVTDTFNIIVNNVDDKPVVINPIADITVNEDASISDIDLTDVFSDIDNENATISKAINSTNNESIVSFNITDNTLSATLKADQFGELEVVIEATSNLLTVTDTFNITVNAVDDAPVVTNPIADVTVDEDATITTIDLSNVFTDIDNDNAAITKAIVSDNDESLLSMNITNDMLNVTLKDDQYGELEVVIEASSNTKTVTETFNIKVNAVNDAPTVSNTIADKTVDMNANNVEIDLSEIFTDIDEDALSITVDNNTNTDLVTTQIENNILTLSFTKDQHGEATIRIMADDGTLNITTSFKVKVNNITGINYTKESVLNIYPNPANDFVIIKSPFEISKIVILNNNGSVQQVYKANNCQTEIKLDITSLPTGTYFISIEGDNSRIVKTIIKI